jgi:hypothetical protein
VKKVSKIEKLTSKFSRKLSRGTDKGRDVLVKDEADVLELATERKGKRLSVAGGEPRYNGCWTNGVK